MPRKKPTSKNKIADDSNAKSKRAVRRKVEDLVDRVWDTDDLREQTKYLNEALELDPGYADAYFLLAEFALGPEAALPLYEQAVACEERELGAETFRDLRGEFWEIDHTRPYMSYLRSFADCLLTLGKVDEAVEHFKKLLELDSNDSQANRYRLFTALLLSDRLDELDKTLKKHREQSADWLYARALLTFRKEGASTNANRWLRKAEAANSIIPEYLCRTKMLPTDMPRIYSPGSEEEAILYAAATLPAWRHASGAVTWLRDSLQLPLMRPTEDKPRAASWSKIRARLKQLPIDEDAVWEIDVFASDSSDEPLWNLVIIDAISSEVLVFESFLKRPGHAAVWEIVVETMANPKEEEPFLPAAVRVVRKSWANAWTKKLDQIDVGCELAKTLETLDEFRDFAERTETTTRRLSEELPAAPAEFERLPLAAGEVWQMIFRKMPIWLEDEGQMKRPSCVLIVDATNRLIVKLELLKESATEDEVWDVMRAAIAAPAAGDPRRPESVCVLPAEVSPEWGQRLEEIGVKCDFESDLDTIGPLYDDLVKNVGGERRMKPLITVPGITPTALGVFYEAAADFFRAAPWRTFPGDVILRADTDAFSSGPWYVAIMGQSGIEMGIAVYEDKAQLKRLLRGQWREDEGVRQMSALSVLFGEVYDMAAEDVDAIEQHDWAIATPEAYPAVLRVLPGKAMRTPMAWEVELLEALLRALREYVRQQTPDELTTTVATASRTVTLKLSRATGF